MELVTIETHETKTEAFMRDSSQQEAIVRFQFFFISKYSYVLKDFYYQDRTSKRSQAPQQRKKIILSEMEVYQVVEFLKTLTTDNSGFVRPKIP